MKQFTVVLIGAGNRGQTYTDLMLELPEKYRVVAVADPVESCRESIRKKHGLPQNRCFRTHEQLLAQGKLADLALICTQDQMHFAHAMAAMAQGYDLLLEKPVTPEPETCLQMLRYAQAHGRKVLVCHVLRYTPFFHTIKSIIDQGVLGQIISINHEECVGNVHQSHSFVRGKWGNEGRSACMLLAKSCHDIDILQWLIGKKCRKVQSFGALRHFVPANRPTGAPEYCIQGCPEGERCPYNAVKLYLEDKKNDWFRTACSGEAAPTDAQVENALRTTQFGKCVYACDNDVVDHQTVNMLFEDDITVTFTMCAFNRGGRFIHIMGTKGELHGAMHGEEPITVYDFATKTTRTIPMSAVDGIQGGHGGGDGGILLSLHDYLSGCHTGHAVSELEISVENHLVVFAAEKARREMTIVDLQEYMKSLP